MPRKWTSHNPHGAHWCRLFAVVISAVILFATLVFVQPAAVSAATASPPMWAPGTGVGGSLKKTFTANSTYSVGNNGGGGGDPAPALTLAGKPTPEPVPAPVSLPDSLISYDTSEIEKIIEGSVAVAGMPEGGWVRVEKLATQLILTTSDGLRVEISASQSMQTTVNFNSRGTPVFYLRDLFRVSGSGLLPNTPASTWLFSTPTALGRLVVDARGEFSSEYALPADFPIGDHTAQLNVIAPDGTLRIIEVAVEIIAEPETIDPPIEAEEPSVVEPTVEEPTVEEPTVEEPTVEEPTVEEPTVDEPVAAPQVNSTPVVPTTPPLSNSETIELIASALALLAIVRRRSNDSALILYRRQRSDDEDSDEEIEREDEGGEVASVKASFGDSDNYDGIDRVRPPRVRFIDLAMSRLGEKVDRRMPMLARSANDGVYLRSLLGVFWSLLPVAGAALGAWSAFDTDFIVMTPALSLVIAIVVIGCLDAFAGLSFGFVYGLAMLLGGGLDSTNSVRGYLGIAVFAFAPALIASATRPFRRLVSEKDHGWNLSVDFVLVALFGSWAAGSMYGAIPSLTTFKPLHSDRVDLIHVVVLVALASRWLLENSARILTPQRLAEIKVEEFESPSMTQRVISDLVRTGLFLFVASVFIGNNWALWTGAAIFLMPKLIGKLSDSFPNLSWLNRILPSGLTKVVFILFVSTWWGGLVSDQVDVADDVVLYAFVFMSMPGLIFAGLEWFGRESDGWKSTTASKALGVILLIVGFLVVRGVIL